MVLCVRHFIRNKQKIGNFLSNSQRRRYNVVKGDLNKLSPKVKQFVQEKAALCQPDGIYICDGSEQENQSLISMLEQQKVVRRLSKYENSWLACTDPADVARVESKTVISTTNKGDTIPTPKEGVAGALGNWISQTALQSETDKRFPGCMKGRTMYVLPYSMGPVGSPLSKIGVQVTDSAYVTVSMRIMTRMGQQVMDVLGNDDFVKCTHSIGQPLPMQKEPINHWPCNPKNVIVAHLPQENEIVSYGSGYGGNSLLGKKCFALRIGSTLGKKEGWLAEHMLILGITTPKGKKHYIAAAFPSACGKTNLAMMTPTLPGYKVECVGDDIAWMRFDESGVLHAINPENGFFGVAPGTSMQTNPNAMLTIKKNTIFTNTAITADGDFYWQGLEDSLDPDMQVTSWLGDENWSLDSTLPAAHPNSRFCTPAAQCPIIDPEWESQKGVPIEAIVFGGRRPTGVPLVYEAFNWAHGVYVGAGVKSQTTAAAEYKGKKIMHDPFAMRPFFGYNFAHYLEHWLSMQNVANRKMPRIFHVNWFRKNENKEFMWPGFGENSRVLDWIVRRCDGDEGIARESPIGYLPTPGSINIDNISGKVDMERLFHLDKQFWSEEVEEIGNYLNEQLTTDLPEPVAVEIDSMKKRVNAMK